MSDNKICEHCGAIGGRIIKYQRTTYLCWAHYLQKRRHGKYLPRTKYTPNIFEIDGNDCKITLFEGERTPVAIAYVDASDWDAVSKYKWHRANRKGKLYVQASIGRKAMFLHTFLLGEKEGMEIDHRDADTLNNRRSNLRHVTHHQNILNCRTNPKSGRMGITWRQSRNCWVARILIDGKARHRHFQSKEDAIKCRRNWERELVGATMEEIRGQGV